MGHGKHKHFFIIKTRRLGSSFRQSSTSHCLLKTCLLYTSFAPVTFLYGGNGSGKTTLLNLIAERLRIKRGTYFNRSNFFADFVAQCNYEAPRFLSPIADTSRMITSDDVFDYLLDTRCLNEQVDLRREELLAEYTEEKYATCLLYTSRCV